jgi:hypothetical protein
MLYLLQLDVLIAAFVLMLAGLVILGLFAWQQAKALVAAQRRIFQRVTTLIPGYVFASPFAISRTVSRFNDRARFSSHKIQ